MTTTLTNDQITAGAAVLCDHGQPIGRNAAIAVFDAMQGAQPTALLRDHEHAVIAMLPEVHQKLAAAHIAGRKQPDETGAEYATRIMADWDLPDANDAAAPSPQIAEKVELPPLPRYWGISAVEAERARAYAVAYAREAIAASRRAAAPASAGQSAQPLPDMAMSEPVYQVRFEHQLAWNDASEDAYHTFRETSRRIVYLAAQPAEASAGQAGQVAKEPMDFDSFFEVVRASERAAAPAFGDISQSAPTSAPVAHAAQSEKAAAANAAGHKADGARLRILDTVRQAYDDGYNHGRADGKDDGGCSRYAGRRVGDERGKSLIAALFPQPTTQAESISPAAADAGYQMPEGVKNQIETLEWKLRNHERALETRRLHDKADVWYWQGDGADKLDTMSMGMVVVIRADQLRDLIADRAAATSTASLERDAARYRWLASGWTDAELDAAGASGEQPKDTPQRAVIDHLAAWYLDKKQTDDLIDAAMDADRAAAKGAA